MLEKIHNKSFSEVANIILNGANRLGVFSRAELAKELGFYGTAFYKNKFLRSAFDKLVEKDIIKRHYKNDKLMMTKFEYKKPQSFVEKYLGIKTLDVPLIDEKVDTSLFNIEPNKIIPNQQTTINEVINKVENINLVDVVKDYTKKLIDLEGKIRVLSKRKNELINELVNKLKQ